MRHYSLGQSGVAGNSYSYCLPKCLIKAWAVRKLYLMRGQECYELQPALYLLLWCSIQIWTLCECHNSESLCSFDYSCDRWDLCNKQELLFMEMTSWAISKMWVWADRHQNNFISWFRVNNQVVAFLQEKYELGVSLQALCRQHG